MNVRRSRQLSGFAFSAFGMAMRSRAGRKGVMVYEPNPGDVPAHVANGRALLINDYAASPLQARPPSMVAGAKRAA